MHITQLLLTIVMLALAGQATAIGGHKQTWVSETATANATKLEGCLDWLHAELEKDPRANYYDGINCANKTFQVGGTMRYRIGWKNRDVLQRCEADLWEAARAGKDWVNCEVLGDGDQRIAGWGPIGKLLCSWEKPIDHGPC
ncbi:hypothetical protein Slin15195_G115460 [Septoria linicola]|uniref:Uncharacterized protein n=1 Tax=Septoria linicola TaxID=215465 RepID=A0A9Q9B6F7_9PEZI|nr:hypothetical protein Slin15195_G115460 [Septoria linicola]